VRATIDQAPVNRCGAHEHAAARDDNNGPVTCGRLLHAWRRARGVKITVVYVFIVILTKLAQFNAILRA